MEYFITYIHTIRRICRDRIGKVEANKDCFENEPCPDNVVCKKDFGVTSKKPPNLCPTPGCRGQRPLICINDPCKKSPPFEDWRCSLGELPLEARERFEQKLRTVDECGDFLKLQSREELGLSNSETIVTHSELVEKFLKLKSAYLNEPYKLDDSQSRNIPFMMECLKFAKRIRDEEAKNFALRFDGSNLENNTGTKDTEQSKPKIKSTTPKEVLSAADGSEEIPDAKLSENADASPHLVGELTKDAQDCPQLPTDASQIETLQENPTEQESPTEKRNRRFHEEQVEGELSDEEIGKKIAREMNEHPPDYSYSESLVRDGAKKHRAKHGLKEPIRRRGRRKIKKTS